MNGLICSLLTSKTDIKSLLKRSSTTTKKVRTFFVTFMKVTYKKIS